MNSACYSPDGKFILTASSDKTAKIWDVKTLQKVDILVKSKNDENLSDSSNLKVRSLSIAPTLFSACYSQDGRFIITVSATSIKIWNVETKQEVCILDESKDWRNKSACFSPDCGCIVTSSYDGNVIMWNAKTFQKIGTFTGHTVPIASICYSPDSKKIAVSFNDGSVKIWDTKTLQMIGDLVSSFDKVNFACYSPDDKRIATASSDKSAKIYDVKKLQELGDLSGHLASVSTVCYAPDGKTIATASNDKTARIWDANTFQELHILYGHNNYVTSINYSSDAAYVVTASFDGAIKIWEVETGRCKHTMINNNSPCLFVKFSPDNKYICAGLGSGDVQIWNTITFDCVKCWHAHPSFISYLEYSTDGKYIITACQGGTAKIWDTEVFECISVLEGELLIDAALFHADNTRILKVAGDVRVWDVFSNKYIKEIGPLSWHINSAQYSNNQETIVFSTCEGTTEILDGKTFESLGKIRNTPGLMIAGVDFRHLHSDSHFTDEQKEILLQYGAIID